MRTLVLNEDLTGSTVYVYVYVYMYTYTCFQEEQLLETSNKPAQQLVNTIANECKFFFTFRLAIAIFLYTCKLNFYFLDNFPSVCSFVLIMYILLYQLIYFKKETIICFTFYLYLANFMLVFFKFVYLKEKRRNPSSKAS